MGFQLILFMKSQAIEKNENANRKGLAMNENTDAQG
jgi:hypothetical protein